MTLSNKVISFFLAVSYIFTNAPYSYPLNSEFTLRTWLTASETAKVAQKQDNIAQLLEKVRESIERIENPESTEKISLRELRDEIVTLYNDNSVKIEPYVRIRILALKQGFDQLIECLNIEETVKATLIWIREVMQSLAEKLQKNTIYPLNNIDSTREGNRVVEEGV